MASKAHELLLQKEVEYYTGQGYIERARSLPKELHYIPDAVLENQEKVVIVEVVLSCNHELLKWQRKKAEQFFGKHVEFVKVFGFYIPPPKGSKQVVISDENYEKLLALKHTEKGEVSFNDVITELLKK